MASLSFFCSGNINTSTRLLCKLSRAPFGHATTPAEVRASKNREFNTTAALVGAGLTSLTLNLLGHASATELPLLGSSLQLTEPSNALSLPTWAVHVSSVVEWVTAMALVWQYGEKSEYKSWKGLSWGMVPLLGGALCACTWHFFYNSESLENHYWKISRFPGTGACGALKTLRSYRQMLQSCCMKKLEVT